MIRSTIENNEEPIQIRSTDTCLEWLKESNIEFFETGSRFFGTERQNSDYDFFCEWSIQTYRRLKAAGFVDVDSKDGEGESYRHTNQRPHGSLCLLMKMYNVHIQLVDDVKRKGKIQKLIHELGLAEQFVDNKQLARNIWSTLYKYIN